MEIGVLLPWVLEVMRRKKGFAVEEVAQVAFIAAHPILGQFARDLSRTLSPEFTPRHRRVFVFCGIHISNGFAWQLPGYRIAIQTEQFYDQAGRRLWGCDRRRVASRVRRALDKADILLELSEANRRFYNDLDLSAEKARKLRFGPFVFPKEDRTIARVEKGGKMCFVGSTTGDRRAQILADMPPRTVDVVPPGCFGPGLEDRIAEASAVLNIHYQAGTYTEVPRLLSSYLNGKPLVSEELAPPFVAGVHYLDLSMLDGPAAAIEASGARVFNNLARLVRERLAFEDFLRREGI